MTSTLENKRQENVMLDLETLGTSAGCAVICVGACTFDGLHKFYERISPDSARIYLKEDIETLRWWNRQDPQLKAEAFGGTQELIAVLDKFHDWFRRLNAGDYKHTFIWGNGADFDLPILAEAYRVVDRPIPWHPWNGRCYRTLKSLMPAVTAPPRASKKHHALDDAIYQAEHARLLLQVL